MRMLKAAEISEAPPSADYTENMPARVYDIVGNRLENRPMRLARHRRRGLAVRGALAAAAVLLLSIGFSSLQAPRNDVVASIDTTIPADPVAEAAATVPASDTTADILASYTFPGDMEVNVSEEDLVTNEVLLELALLEETIAEEDMAWLEDNISGNSTHSANDKLTEYIMDLSEDEAGAILESMETEENTRSVLPNGVS